MITLQVKYAVAERDADEFQDTIVRVYGQVLAKQEGFISYRLLREYPRELREHIGATSDGYQFQLELTFESEELRRRWAASPDHDPAYEASRRLANQVIHNGFEVVRDSRPL
jgi:heme-degrading monooxygenase HmoA